MVHYFISEKSWRLFLLLVIPYAVGKTTVLGDHFFGFALLVFYFLVVAIGWIYAIGRTANERLADSLKLPLLYFKLACIVPFLCFTFFVAIILSAYQRIDQIVPQWVLYLVFLALSGFSYSLWFAARQFTSLASGTAVSFIESYPVFMSLWFSPLGVWYLQPRVNTLLHHNEN